MPNRIIKESICVSDSIDKLTWFEECLFYRLIVNCDDFGRFDGRIAVVKNRLFPLKDNVTLKAVADGINKLVSVELVALYEFEGRPYLYLPTWNDHQNIRAKRSKYPAPEDSVNADDIICKQMNSNASKCSRNPNPNPNPNPNTRTTREVSRHTHGRYENVLLTDEEFEKLKEEFPSDYLDRIERLSEYIASSGKKYKSHLATIRAWAKKDEPKKTAEQLRVDSVNKYTKFGRMNSGLCRDEDMDQYLDW